MARAKDGPPTPEQVRWFQQARALVEPHARAPHRVPPAPPDGDAAVAALQQELGWRVERITRALPEADERCRGLSMRTLESQRLPARAWIDEPDLEADAARAMLIDVENRGAAVPGGGTMTAGAGSTAIADAFLDVWVLRGGLAHAVAMLGRCHLFEITWRNEGFCLESADGSERWSPDNGIWSKLRRRITTCSDAEYAEAVTAAEAVRAAGRLGLCCSVAYAFPQRPEWAAADALRAVTGGATNPRVGWLLASLRDPLLAEQLAIAGAHPGHAGAHVTTMIDLLGPAAAPAMEAMVLNARGWAMESRRRLARQLAMIETPRVASYFASHLGDRALDPVGVPYLERRPDLAVPALAAAGGARAEGLRERLEAVASPAEAADAGATPPDLPPVLAFPPWLAKGAVRRPIVVRDVAPPPPDAPEEVVWKAGEREFHRSGRGSRYWWGGPEPSAAAREEYTQRARADIQQALALLDGHTWVSTLFRLPDEEAVAVWNTLPPERYRHTEVSDFHRALAAWGLDGLPGLLAYARTERAMAVDALARVRSARVAPLMAAAYVELAKGRRTASAWLQAFPQEAAVGLIADAVGDPGTRRRHAEAALRHLAAQGHEAVVRDVAARCTPDATAAVDALLAQDAYGEYPRRLPKLSPLVWTPVLWTPPRLAASGAPLPAGALEALGTMLAFSAPDDPYVGLRDVKRACEPRSLGAFAWALFEAWHGEGAPSNGEWAFHALGALGDDETARQLAERIEPWSYEGRHGRAVTALRVLAAMEDSDVALASLRGIATRAKSRPLRHEARLRLDEVAARRGLSADQLADLLVTDLGLDAAATRPLDFGPRSFVVTLDEKLKPVVRDAAGRVLRDLPEPGARDDAAIAAAAVGEWKVFKKQVKTVLKAETGRLELAMCTGRRWEPAEFERVVVAHPVLGWLARRLVWGAYDDGGLRATFRVAEDRTLADGSDTQWSAPVGCRVGVAHPVEMGEADVRRWSSLLSDYELGQPFLQLGREVYRAAQAELAERSITVRVGAVVASPKVLALERRGWDRAAGKESEALLKPLHSIGCEAVLPLSPGLFAGDPMGSGDQTLGPVTVRRRDMWSAEDGLTIAEMGVALYSELVRDILSVRA